jgi:hypothetical protein
LRDHPLIVNGCRSKSEWNSTSKFHCNNKNKNTGR